MNRWVLEVLEYNYEIQYLKGKNNFLADHLSRPVRHIVRPPEISWLGLENQQFVHHQREEIVRGELITYLQGGKIPNTKLLKTNLDQFPLVKEILYFFQEKAGASLQYGLINPKTLKTRAIQHAHELSSHLWQKKTIEKAERFYWIYLKDDACNFVKESITCQIFKGETDLQQHWKEFPSVS